MENVIAWAMVALMLGISLFLVGAMISSIRKEKRSENLKRTWANFALSISFAVLFFSSWAVQAVAQWQVYRSEQQAHGEPLQVSEFLNEFAQSTLENWQSEFLQLFSFVVLSALYIHHGSAESKDSDDRMEAALQRIEQKLGTRE